MYINTINPDAYSKSMFMISATESGCCGAGAFKALARYRTGFATGTIATIDRITIDGTTHTFAAAYATTTQAGRDAILAEIESVMTTLLGTNQGRTIFSVYGTQIYVTTDFSQVHFNSIGNGSATAKFAPVKVLMHGNVASDDVNFELTVKPNADGLNYDVWIKPFASKVISAFNIDYKGSTDEYDSSWPKPSSYTLPTGTTIDKGRVHFSALVADAESAQTLVVSITPTGGSIVTFSASVTLSEFKNQ